MALTSVTDALLKMTERGRLLGVERLPLSEAHGRILAEDLGAKVTQPPFDGSAMDGYAVRAADVAALPATLELVGQAAAGQRFEGTLQAGQAVRIFTGAPIPDGADTVVIQEDTEAADDRVVVKEADAGRHIRPRGQDFREGDVLLKIGSRLGARSLMLAAAMNYADVLVRRKPTVAIISTGDEIMPPGSDLGPDQIVASVGYGIAAYVRENGGIPIDLGLVRDDAKALDDAITKARDADILVTIGGASVGDRDLVRGALAKAGMELDFAKVSMRPGKPVFSGRLGDTRVLGLPGNPVSAHICAIVFLRILLGSFLGWRGALEAQGATLICDLPENGPRANYMRATSTLKKDGTRYVEAQRAQDSSLMDALAKSDCLIVRPERAPALKPGDKVVIWPLAD